MSKINIRSILDSDNQKVKEIIINSLIEYGANREGFAAKDPELDALSVFYTNSGGIYFVAEESDEILGGAGIAPLKGNSEVWELQKMYLAKNSRGKGIGKQLMEKCIQEAKKRNISKLYIETLDSMIEANSMYKKFGFEEVLEPVGDTGHFGCDKYYILKLDD